MNRLKRFYLKWAVGRTLAKIKANTNIEQKEYYTIRLNAIKGLIPLMTDMVVPRYARVKLSTSDISEWLSNVNRLIREANSVGAIIPEQISPQQRQLTSWLVDASNSGIEFDYAFSAIEQILTRYINVISQNTNYNLKDKTYGYSSTWKDLDAFILSCYERVIKEIS